MAAARRIVEEAVAGDEIVYGITTGFGALSTTRVEPEEAAELQVNLAEESCRRGRVLRCPTNW